MSRIINAANRAETERNQMREQAERGKGLSGYVQSLKQELRDEFKWMGTVMARWDPAAAPTPASAANGPVAGEASPALSGPQAGDTAKAHAVTPSWERAMGLVTQQLARCEQQATEEANAQVRLKAQVAELEQQARRVEQERQMARQRLEHAAQAASALEAARLALSQQVDAARACQVLAHDLLTAAQDFEANAAAITQLAQGKPPSADAVAYYQQLADALQQQVVQLTSRLSRAVAALGGSTPTTQQPTARA